MSKINSLADYEELSKWLGKVLRIPRQKALISSQEPATTTHNKATTYLTANSRMTEQERLDIYSKDYWSRCLESLFEDFPALNHLIPSERLEDYFIDYVQQYSSHSYTLRDLGCSLENYWREQNIPYAALYRDVTAFEFALIESFDEPAKSSYHPENLTQSQRENLAQLPFQLQPYVRILDLHYGADFLRQEIFKESPLAIAPQEMAVIEVYFIISRVEYHVHYNRVSQLASRFFRLFQRPQTLSQACEEFMQQLTTTEQAEFSQNIQHWMEKANTESWLFLVEEA